MCFHYSYNKTLVCIIMLGHRSVITDYVYLLSGSILSHVVTGCAEPEHQRHCGVGT